MAATTTLWRTYQNSLEHVNYSLFLSKWQRLPQLKFWQCYESWQLENQSWEKVNRQTKNMWILLVKNNYCRVVTREVKDWRSLYVINLTHLPARDQREIREVDRTVVLELLDEGLVGVAMLRVTWYLMTKKCPGTLWITFCLRSSKQTGLVVWASGHCVMWMLMWQMDVPQRVLRFNLMMNVARFLLQDMNRLVCQIPGSRSEVVSDQMVMNMVPLNWNRLHGRELKIWVRRRFTKLEKWVYLVFPGPQCSAAWRVLGVQNNDQAILQEIF